MPFETKVMKLKAAIESKGGFDKFMPWFREQIHGTKDKKPTLELHIFSIKELSEAVNTSQFPIITGELISKKIMDSYDAYPKVADELVTTMPSKLQIDKVPGLWLKGTLEDVQEGHDYPHAADMEEEYVQVAGTKRGLILDITEEAVMFDQTGSILMKAGRMGDKLAQDREDKVLYCIQDATVSGVNYYVWYPAGTRTALYRASNAASANVAGGTIYANQVTDALADYTDIQAALDLFALMKDNDGKHIRVMPKILLVPLKLETMATRLISNEFLPGTTTGVGYNEKNPFWNKFKVIATPHIDDVSNNDWYIGDPKRQFVEKVVIPLQIQVRRDKTNDLSWERDIKASYKVRHFTQPFTVDHRFFVKSTGGS